jgi:polyisoprenyl-phosphate glycosyltransferase
LSESPEAPSRRRPRPRLLSVVTPAYNEAEGLPQLVKELGGVLPALADDHEIIVVDDGSTDDTEAVLARLHAADGRIRYLSLSRNFGHQPALLAGLEHARGDVVVTMDADLQHPPELLPEMVERWRSGDDVVYTTKAHASRSLSFQRRLLMRVGYAVLRFVSGMKLEFGQSDFRLLDRAVVDALVSMPERDKFLRGLVDWIGFRQTGIEYEPRARFAGTEKYTFRQLLRLVTTGVFSFSILPLRLFTMFGMTIALLSMAYGVVAVIAGAYALIAHDPTVSPPGWATLAAAITFLGGIQLIGIGLLGEYLGRVYDETKARPTYVVRAGSAWPDDDERR